MQAMRAAQRGVGVWRASASRSLARRSSSAMAATDSNNSSSSSSSVCMVASSSSSSSSSPCWAADMAAAPSAAASARQFGTLASTGSGFGTGFGCGLGPSARLLGETPVQAAAKLGSSQRTIVGQSFNIGEMQVFRREESGSRLCRKARSVGLVPGIVYGKLADGRLAKPLLIWTRAADIMKELKHRGASVENTQFDITYQGETIRCLPRQLEMHPVRDEPVRMNFLRYNPGQKPGARIEIPLKAVNEDRCPAIKDGGWVMTLRRKIPVFASGEEIPDVLTMDLRGKRLGQKVQMSEIFLNEGIVLRHKRGQDTNFAVAKMVGKVRS